MTYHVFHSDCGVAMAIHRVFDTCQAALDYIDHVFLPGCRDGMAHVFHGDSMMMSVCVADGQVTTRRPDCGQYIFF